MAILKREPILLHQRLCNVLDRYLEDLIPEIENWWEIWYAISNVTEIPYLFENPQVLAAIGRRSADFAYSTRLRGDYWHIINVGTLFDEVLSDESVIESIIHQLQASYNPWQFLDTEQLDLLLKNRRINEGLKERIPDFVYGITHTTEALFIIEGIQKIEFLRNDERIIHAVAEFRRSVG